MQRISGANEDTVLHIAESRENDNMMAKLAFVSLLGTWRVTWLDSYTDISPGEPFNFVVQFDETNPVTASPIAGTTDASAIWQLDVYGPAT